jgi:hypothetical protein
MAVAEADPRNFDTRWSDAVVESAASMVRSIKKCPAGGLGAAADAAVHLRHRVVNGTSPDNFGGSSWRDWIAVVDSHLTQLRDRLDSEWRTATAVRQALVRVVKP